MRMPDAIPYNEWPMCPIKGCMNRICLSLDSQFCWPHTKGDKSWGELLAELNEELAPAEEQRANDE
jgi:hypothetical protein